jgi:hypothetical protein
MIDFVKDIPQRNEKGCVIVGKSGLPIGFGQEINKPNIPIGDLLKRIEKLEHNLKNLETILNNLLEAKK